MAGGFFGSAAVPGGTVVGNLLGKGGLFGPIFIPAHVAVGNLSIVAALGSFGGTGGTVMSGFEGTAQVGPGTVGACTAVHDNPPVIITGVTLISGVGDGSPGPFGGAQFVYGVFGAPAQNFFTSITIVELGITRFTAAADNFSNGGGCGPTAYWGWNGLVGMVPGGAYTFAFAL